MCSSSSTKLRLRCLQKVSDCDLWTARSRVKTVCGVVDPCARGGARDGHLRGCAEIAARGRELWGGNLGESL
jgi:hypothetical protein